jgi:hypothetical protein
MEQRHDWAKFNFTMDLFKYVFTVLIPVVVSHSQLQDEEQVRDHYDRTIMTRLRDVTLTYFHFRRRRLLRLVLGSTHDLYLWYHHRL